MYPAILGNRAVFNVANFGEVAKVVKNMGCMEVQLEEMMDVRESARFESDTEVTVQRALLSGLCDFRSSKWDIFHRTSELFRIGRVLVQISACLPKAWKSADHNGTPNFSRSVWANRMVHQTHKKYLSPSCLSSDVWARAFGQTLKHDMIWEANLLHTTIGKAVSRRPRGAESTR